MVSKGDLETCEDYNEQAPLKVDPHNSQRSWWVVSAAVAASALVLVTWGYPFLGDWSETYGNVADTGRRLSMEDQWYVSPENDPIPVSIRLMHSSVMDGYPSGDEGCKALTADIYNASALIANEAIKGHAKEWYRQYSGHIRHSRMRSFSAPEKSSDGGAVREEDSYVANNQESGVDEADIIKSDGDHVFVGYGDLVVVWDAVSGQELSRTKLPERKTLTTDEGGSEYDSQRKTKISGMILDSDSNRLVVFASGYSSTYRFEYEPILSKTDDIRILLYDLTSIPADESELSLISSTAMDGEYVSARKVGSAAHVVRRSDVDTYNHISRHLKPDHEDFWRDTKETYIVHATAKAKRFLPTFAQRLADELKGISGGNDCSAVSQLVLFASADNDVNQDGVPDSLKSDISILRSYLQVSSFVFAPPSQQMQALSIDTTGSFFPSVDTKMYASEDVLVVAGRGYHCNTRSWSQSTYFFAYQLRNEGNAPKGLGMSIVPGYLLNQFSMDEYNGYLRVATTQENRWACVPGYWNCRWERESQSKSMLSVLKFPQEYGKMELIKVIDDLGVTEQIKSARFFDDKAYIVTFQKTDPLYTINFTHAENPVVTDELKVSGYSSYLHPVGSDRLLAIGKEVNETTGRNIGFQITLFNVSDLENTSVLQRHTIKQSWSSSAAEDDHLAFRYLPMSKLLILPISIRDYSWRDNNERMQEDFDGFKIYKINDHVIEERYSLSLVRPSRINRGCWYHTYLPPRSLVFSGNVTLVKGHGYMSYDMVTEQFRWKHNLDHDLTKCWSYWS